MGRPKKTDAIEAYRKNIQAKYRYYCYYVHKKDWIPTKYHVFLCDTVQDFLEQETGNPYDILILSCSPQTGKSMTITETLPSYYLMTHPKDSVLEVSYNDDFAKKFGRRNKEKIQEYGQLFGVGLSNETKSASEWELDNKIGRMMSNGIDGTLTGNKANLMIIDDPIKNSSDAASKTKRDTLWDKWFTTMRSRLSPGGKVILIMTRWHEDDLAGRLSKDPFSTVVNIPCEAEENDPLGREIGDGPCAEIGKDRDWKDKLKASMIAGDVDENGEAGLRAWNALYQGHPTSQEGNIIKREWWQYYTIDETPRFDRVIMSVDCAFKNAEDNDYVAIEVWGKYQSKYYLIDLIKDHLDFPQTVAAIYAMKHDHPEIREVLVEDKANGSAVIQVMRGKINGVIAVEPEGGKEARVNAVSFVIEAKTCYLPSFKSFTNDFVEECAGFPNAPHDDCVDAASQALARLIFARSTGEREIVRNNLLFPPEKKKHWHNRAGKGEKIHVI